MSEECTYAYLNTAADTTDNYLRFATVSFWGLVLDEIKRTMEVTQVCVAFQ